ncbi:MAG TPA: right-handed parallel beta-helix repeat-containing protein [Candidatus Binatia bacterium]|nr:right-handed parallel beta-helix repeat-containing protein [Candidatus Binatia bacterium]
MLAGAAAAPAAATAKVFNVAAGDVYGPRGLVAAITEANGNGQNNNIVLPPGSLYRLDRVDNDTVDVFGNSLGANGLPIITGRMAITTDNGFVTARTRQATIERPDGAPPFRILYVSSTGVLRLANIVVRGGIGGGDLNAGGGLLNLGPSTILINSVVRNNAASAGAGIYNGGADAVLSLIGSEIRENTAESTDFAGLHGGGGIYNDAGTVTIRDSAISRNGSPLARGGGIANVFEGTVTLVNSTVSYNGDGGGIFNSDSVLTISNSTISRNHASGDGGGIYNTRGDSVLDLNNVTIAENDAGDGFSGGGFFNTSLRVDIRNSLIAGNTIAGVPHASSADCWGNIPSLGYNLLGDATGCNFVPATSDVVGVDPLLGPLQDNGGLTQTHAPGADVTNSPAIDGGNPAAPGSSSDACLATDQRGFRRPIDGPDASTTATCDIGAFESGMRPVNDLLTGPGLTPDRLNTTPVPLNIAGCAEGFLTYRVPARYTNTSAGGAVLTELVAEVVVLTNDNLLWNADGHPGGIKARLTFPRRGQFADGRLGPGESVDVPLVFCLRRNRSFAFVVNVFGIVR